MAKVSVSEAARLAGISRTNFYKNYIHTGKITVEQNVQQKPVVDTSEILRVFGQFKGLQNKRNDDSILEQKITHEKELQNNNVHNQSDSSREVIELLKSQLLEAKDRELWLQKQIEELTSTVKLLEDKQTKSQHEKARLTWWPFGKREE